MKDFTLLTVPHTGTHFMFKFLEDTLGVVRKDRSVGGEEHTYVHRHTNRTHWDDLTAPTREIFERDLLSKSHVLVTARDPYLSVFHYFDIAPDRLLSHQVGHWNMFIDILPELNHFVVDIGCPEEKRYEHLCEAADFAQVPFKSDDVKRFADAWKPENVRNSDMKLKYLTDGTLPDPRGESWDLLKPAVEWYKNLPTNAHI